ncbi:TPA: hypothetical protein RJR39_000190 [Burkholderia cenocepacia]|uniref:NACHT domain-containing protein n=1 Tax=Burkholderia cenocepacia TaxID=95486 RepID=UPI001BA39784|nr:hypothetical protein [Burkholderia cenocepacia]MBR8194516.1 hypothetical protein [Burkholderia cenocepacia]HDV6324160.1 hypothetical protein [Burkholderia cenocepacia]HDV6352325.1 hypothetical protein [Burkholderia cenocepacia]
MSSNYKANMSFEAEVRRIAEAVWNMMPGMCQPMHYPDDPVVREIDGIARLRDVTHLLMVTTSTRLDKVKGDCKKLQSAEAIERTRAGAVSKWMITQDQLDAQHIEYARKQNVQILTLAQFQRRFFDGAKYVSLRARAAFGSARDPRTDSISIADDAYVALPMRIAIDSSGKQAQLIGRSISLEQIASRLRRGELIVLRAPFGSGKSLTTRELFKRLAAEYSRNSTEPVPVVLNLREHWGEDYADEILDRHARTIGYTPREDMVVAWRAGMCALLLDGFDEVASQAVANRENKNFMREARRQALAGVRDFTQKLPAEIGVLVCGRDQYFDSDVELAASLGISGRKYLVVDLGEFDEKSANDFLRKQGINQALPDWLPRKPLLLSYLLREKLFDEILTIDGTRGFGHAWDSFLSAIAVREASLPRSTMEAETVRAVLERLAFSVRGKSSGTGPISGVDLAEAYTAETGQTAGEGVLAQLQRLPGLARPDAESGTRSFVDFDMLAALQGSGVARYILGAADFSSISPLSALGDRAQDMAAYLLSQKGTSSDTLISVCMQFLRNAFNDRGASQRAADCLAVAIRIAIQNDVELDMRGSVIDGASFEMIPFDEVKVKNLSLRNCTIGEVRLGEIAGLDGVSVTGSLIGRVVGVSSRVGVPEKIISSDCEVEAYDNVSTNSAVLKLDMQPQLKALLTILRKLYKQAGGGRKISAFSRGITRPDVLRFIDPVLSVLERHQFVSIFNSIVHPVRRQAGRVESILAAPAIVDDPMTLEVKNLE